MILGTNKKEYRYKGKADNDKGKLKQIQSEQQGDKGKDQEEPGEQQEE